MVSTFKELLLSRERDRQQIKDSKVNTMLFVGTQREKASDSSEKIRKFFTGEVRLEFALDH